LDHVFYNQHCYGSNSSLRLWCRWSSPFRWQCDGSRGQGFLSSWLYLWPEHVLFGNLCRLIWLALQDEWLFIFHWLDHCGNDPLLASNDILLLDHWRIIRRTCKIVNRQNFMNYAITSNRQVLLSLPCTPPLLAWVARLPRSADVFCRLAMQGVALLQPLPIYASQYIDEYCVWQFQAFIVSVQKPFLRENRQTSSLPGLLTYDGTSKTKKTGNMESWCIRIKIITMVNYSRALWLSRCLKWQETNVDYENLQVVIRTRTGS